MKVHGRVSHREQPGRPLDVPGHVLPDCDIQHHIPLATGLGDACDVAHCGKVEFRSAVDVAHKRGILLPFPNVP